MLTERAFTFLENQEYDKAEFRILAGQEFQYISYSMLISEKYLGKRVTFRFQYILYSMLISFMKGYTDPRWRV